MSQLHLRVFHCVAALASGTVSFVLGFLTVMVMENVLRPDTADRVPLSFFALTLGCLFVFQFTFTLFSLLGTYRLSVRDGKLVVDMGVGPLRRIRQFPVMTIADAAVFAYGNWRRPAIGIVTDRTFIFGYLLPRQTIIETVAWIRHEAGLEPLTS